MEHLYTPAEIAKMLRVSVDPAYRIFEWEPGVILLESASRLAMPKAEAKKLGRWDRRISRSRNSTTPHS